MSFSMPGQVTFVPEGGDPILFANVTLTRFTPGDTSRLGGPMVYRQDDASLEFETDDVQLAMKLRLNAKGWLIWSFPLAKSPWAYGGLMVGARINAFDGGESLPIRSVKVQFYGADYVSDAERKAMSR